MSTKVTAERVAQEVVENLKDAVTKGQGAGSAWEQDGTALMVFMEPQSPVVIVEILDTDDMDHPLWQMAVEISTVKPSTFEMVLVSAIRRFWFFVK